MSDIDKLIESVERGADPTFLVDRELRRAPTQEQSITTIGDDLRQQLGQAFLDLSTDDQVLLASDAFALMRDENVSSEDEAVRTLIQRIGGPANIRSYVNTLTAGEKRKGRK